MWVVLLTDFFLYLLLAGVALYVGFVLRTPHLRHAWRSVMTRRGGAVSVVVLGFFAAIAVLDSMHFHPRLEQPGAQVEYSNEILSVFDVLVGPLRTQVERTYSAPFAYHAHSKETRETPQGRIRVYPRLEYAGAHLADPEQERGWDITVRVLRGALLGAGVWGLLSLGVWLARRFRGARPRAEGEAAIPWRSVAVTVLLILMLIGIVTQLAGAYHVFGTDKVGEDVLYQTLKSIRTGVLIGTLTTLIMLPFAIALGITAGYYRGWVDDVIQYIYITLNSIPGVLLIAAAILSLHVYLNAHADEYASLAERADLRLLFLCMILGLTSWTGLCRLLRGESLKLREHEYIQAAVAFGVSGPRILMRHILPNVMHIVLITVVLDFSGLVLAEAVLSYVDIGVDPSMNSWGNMINSARLEMSREPPVWWSLTASFVFMFALVLFANLLSDAVRDAFDPRVKR